VLAAFSAREFAISANRFQACFEDGRLDPSFVDLIEIDLDTAREVGLFSERHVDEAHCT